MSDTTNEISSLVQGLAAEIERRQARGARHTIAPTQPAPVSSAAAPAASTHTRAVAAACQDLPALAQAVTDCRACALSETRIQPVFAPQTENSSARIDVLFVAEAPGAAEEASGLPMAGEAGELLDKIIQSGMHLEPANVHVTQLVKCRPPKDRPPLAAEKLACSAFLEREVELLQPKLLMALGAKAAAFLLKVERIDAGARGRVHSVQDRKLIPTFHPAFLLENPDKKRDCWQDVKVALEQL